MKANMDIRNLLESRFFRLWQLAEALGMQDSNLSKKLRHELSDEEKQLMIQTIDRMTERRNQEYANSIN